MEQIINNITALNQMVMQGRAMEAFEKFYDEHVVMQENELPPTIGKEANRKREETFFGNISAFRQAQPLHVVTGNDISMVQWHYDYTHREWGVRNYTQVSVQHWKNGKIVKEQFFYGS